MSSAAFIVFEGGEGSGKSTQAKTLARRLQQLGTDVVLTHEPGGTSLGKKLRRWVKWGRGLTFQTELLFFLASRSQLVCEVIRPALENGRVVICDRFSGSTFAYQGYGRGMDMDMVRSFNNFVTNGLAPDLILLLDIDVEDGLRRRNRRWDSFEREDFVFHQKVRDGYLKLAAENKNWVIIDASRSVSEVEEQVWELVRDFLTYGNEVNSAATSAR
ncbi:MAG: dTMP kinase [Dehalococcoidia bacterium]|nr:dTMP kinase [Dehalococcoidia bacterium]